MVVSSVQMVWLVEALKRATVSLVSTFLDPMEIEW